MKDRTDPTNRDTVPAMLTPGEFVLNKEASQMYKPQIEAMNNNGLQLRAERNRGGPIGAKPGGYNSGGLVQFLKDKEGWRDKAYQDDAGVWTIGYGRTGGIKKGDTTTRDAEDKWLDKRAAKEMSAINDYADTYGYEWNDGQKQALASFRYNGGPGMLDMLTADGTRDNATILKKFPQYNKVTDPNTGEKVKIDGLANRRAAELELWNGNAAKADATAATTPAPEPAETVPSAPAAGINAALTEALTGEKEAPPGMPDINNVPFPEEEGPQASGLSSLSMLAGGLGSNNIQAPGLQGKGEGPAFIPSVASGPGGQGMALPNSNPMANNDIAMGQNNGGPIHLNRGGGAGKVKVWDKDTGKYVWVGKDDPRAAPAQASEKAAIERLQAKQQPMNFAAATTQEIPSMNAPAMPNAAPANVSTMDDNQPIYDNAWDGLAQGLRMQIAGRQLEPGVAPMIDKVPPVPGSDEALLQGGSQQVEATETSDQEAQMAAQEEERKRQNAMLGDYAKQFPKGDPRRAAAFNQQAHQKGGMPEGPVPELPPAPPPTDFGPVGGVGPGNTPEPIANTGAGATASEQTVEQLFDQRFGAGQYAAVESGSVEPTEEMLDFEDQTYNSVDELNRTRMLQSTAGEGTQGQDFLAQKEQSLVAALTETPTAPGYEGGSVPSPSMGQSGYNPDTVVQPDAGGYAPVPPMAQSGLPQIDTNAPVAKGPEVMSDAPGGMSIPAMPGEDIPNPVTAEQSTTIASQQGLAAPMTAAEYSSPLIDEKAPMETSAEKEERTTAAAEEVITAAAETQEPQAPNEVMDEVESAGQSVVDNKPEETAVIKDTLKGAFGDLIDGKELVRMAVVYAGALATGASPGRALAMAGQMYLGRVDAKKSQYQKVATSGDYTKESVAAFKESGDPLSLIPVGTPATATGNFKTLYGPGGQEIQAQEMKIGDNTVLMDENGKPVNGFKFSEDGSKVPGTKEYRARIKTDTTLIKDQLKEMQETFDAFETADGVKGTTTDILPASSAGKVAEWAAKNGVEPAQLTGLVESAYHDAINDKRQDGARARNLVPYLQQLVIRKQVGNNEGLFKNKGETGFVNTQKLQTLNQLAYRVIGQKMGKKGTVNDLSNQFYGLAAGDWGNLSKDQKEMWDKKATDDVNGFYLFAEDMLMNSKF